MFNEDETKKGDAERVICILHSLLNNLACHMPFANELINNQMALRHLKHNHSNGSQMSTTEIISNETETRPPILLRLPSSPQYLVNAAEDSSFSHSSPV